MREAVAIVFLGFGVWGFLSAKSLLEFKRAIDGAFGAKFSWSKKTEQATKYFSGFLFVIGLFLLFGVL